MQNAETEKDLWAYKQLLVLWSRENPIKTNKLQVLLVVNGILLSALNISGGFTKANWPLYLGGALFCLSWVLSIGRTSLFQKLWQIKIRDIASRYPDDVRFHVHEAKSVKDRAPFLLRIFGGVSSKYYLVGMPILLFLVWTVLLLGFVLF